MSLIQKNDVRNVTIIGAAVGLLVQPVITNTLMEIERATGLSESVLRIACFFGFLLLAPLALWVASVLGKFLPVIYQFAKFAAVGSLNSFMNLGVFNLETLLVSQNPTKFVFGIFASVAWLTSATNSYFWNKYWTFDKREKPNSAEVILFYAITIGSWLLSVGASTLVYSAKDLGFTSPAVWTNVVSPIAGFLTAFIWNFLGYKFFVFRKNT